MPWSISRTLCPNKLHPVSRLEWRYWISTELTEIFMEGQVMAVGSVTIPSSANPFKGRRNQMEAYPEPHFF